MSEYTPTTGDVEHYYELARDEWNHGEELTGEQYRAEFARWLAAHDEQVRADERERIAQEIDSNGMISRRDLEPYWEGWDDAIQRAGGIARQGGSDDGR